MSFDLFSAQRSLMSDDMASPLAEALTRASWRLRRTSVKELAPLGLTFAQSRVLRILARRDEPIRMGDLAARFEVAPRSATSMIDSLETLGLVERRADPTDRRSVLVGLTPDGLALMARMGKLRRASAETLFGRLTPAQQGQLLEILTVLNEPEDEDGAAPVGGAVDDAGGADRGGA
jgi:DNA-binding MarR family transcriptional regulator